jgi:hypothetical protein
MSVNDLPRLATSGSWRRRLEWADLEREAPLLRPFQPQRGNLDYLAGLNCSNSFPSVHKLLKPERLRCGCLLVEPRWFIDSNDLERKIFD